MLITDWLIFSLLVLFLSVSVVGVITMTLAYVRTRL